MGTTNTSSAEPIKLGSPGGYGPPPGGGYGPPPGGGYGGPPPGGGYGPPPGGGYGPPPGGGYGPPGGGGFGPPGGAFAPPGYGPPGYRPPPPRGGGSGGKIAIGCFGIFLLGGAGVGFLQYQARTRLNEYTKQREVDSKRVDKVFAKLTEAQQQKGGVEKCVTTMNERLAKVHAAKDDPPTSIPEGAALVCDSTDWQTGCHTPSVFASNTAFSTATPCADPAVTERQKLELLSSTKPYPGDSKTDAWIQDVNATIAAHKTAQALLKPPGGIAALSSECTATALESFVDNSSGIHRQLEASTCAVSMTWVDASGNIMGRLKASGHGSPPSSARGAATLSESEMDSANAESQRNALEDGWAQIQKRIDVVNKKAGAAPKGVAPPKSPAVAPAPKAHSPAPAAPAPKSPTPTVPAPKSPAPQPPPKQK